MTDEVDGGSIRALAQRVLERGEAIDLTEGAGSTHGLFRVPILSEEWVTTAVT